MADASITTQNLIVSIPETPAVVGIDTQSPAVDISQDPVSVTIGASLQPADIAITTSAVVVSVQTQTIPVAFTNGVVGPQGPKGDGWVDKFETVSRNLKTYPFTIDYDGEDITSISYDLGGGAIITKSFIKTGNLITSIVLSGDIPAGIDTTKTLLYDVGDNIIGAVYS